MSAPCLNSASFSMESFLLSSKAAKVPAPLVTHTAEFEDTAKELWIADPQSSDS